MEVPIPSPSKGEVLIRMEATSINRVDWRFQKGVARPVMPRKFPFISGKHPWRIVIDDVPFRSINGCVRVHVEGCWKPNR